MRLLALSALLPFVLAATAVETVAAAVEATKTTASAGTTCTVTAYASISSAVKSCTNILLSDVAVPASSTLNLKSLQTGATVTFAGKTVSRYNLRFERSS